MKDKESTLLLITRRAIQRRKRRSTLILPAGIASSSGHAIIARLAVRAMRILAHRGTVKVSLCYVLDTS